MELLTLYLCLNVIIMLLTDAFKREPLNLHTKVFLFFAAFPAAVIVGTYLIFKRKETDVSESSVSENIS